ncbi:MAG TPA: hypothetical protein VJP85_04700 [Candidatus Baltobacteraceae bacterium]|nr:hypothetical protein [Candidatus Baltobacteraceae bacterium]
MLKNWKAALATLVFAATSFGAGAAMTASAQARGEWGSAGNIVSVRNRLNGLIEQLERDNHDYDGHRVAAIDEMQQAQAQLTDALRFDGSHPGR